MPAKRRTCFLLPSLNFAATTGASVGKGLSPQKSSTTPWTRKTAPNPSRLERQSTHSHARLESHPAKLHPRSSPSSPPPPIRACRRPHLAPKINSSPPHAASYTTQNIARARYITIHACRVLESAHPAPRGSDPPAES